MIDPRQIRIVGTNREHEEASIIESVGRIGVINPVTVYQDDNGFVLVAGHRRVASAIHFGLDEIPIKIIPKALADEVRALENIDRKALSPLDESVEIDKLLKCGYSRSDVAAIMGIPETRVSRRVRLRNLTDKARDALASGKVSLRVAEELAVVDSKFQDEIVDHGYGFSTPEAVRSFCWERRGCSLKACSGSFLQLEGDKGVPCSLCPDNPRSDEELFGDVEGIGVCCNLSCWRSKIEKLYRNGDYAGLVYKYGMPDDFKSFDDIPVFESYHDGHYFDAGNEYGPMYLTVFGEEVRDSSNTPRSAIPTDVLGDLIKEYSALVDEFNSLLTSYRFTLRKEFEKTLSFDSIGVELASALAKAVGFRSLLWTEHEKLEDMSPVEILATAVAFARTFTIDGITPVPLGLARWSVPEFKRGDYRQLAAKLDVKSPKKLEKQLDAVLDRMAAVIDRFNSEKFSNKEAK